MLLILKLYYNNTEAFAEHATLKLKPNLMGKVGRRYRSCQVHGSRQNWNLTDHNMHMTKRPPTCTPPPFSSCNQNF